MVLSKTNRVRFAACGPGPRCLNVNPREHARGDSPKSQYYSASDTGIEGPIVVEMEAFLM